MAKLLMLHVVCFA